MNFSALNTHAIGVQLVTASAVVEGAGSFSAEAGASAQVTLHSHAIAVSITSVAVATTQSVIRFAAATATMGCNAAANTEGYRVQFSNAEIVCTASNDANAVVQRQAVVYVTAQATNVAVGSRVAYASASLQAECNLTANSGKATFVSGTFTGSSLTISDASLLNDLSLTIAAQAELAVTASVFKFVATSENESGTQLFVITASGGNYYINGVVNASLDLKYGFTYTFDISDSSLLSHPLLISTTPDGSHNGGSTYDLSLLGSDYSYIGSPGTAGASLSFTLSAATAATNLYYYCPYHSGMGGSITNTQGNVGIATVAANSGTTSFNTGVIFGAANVALAPTNVADSSPQFNGFASATSESHLIKSCTSDIVASSAITASSLTNVFVSAAISGNAVAISIGNKISIGDAQFNGAALTTALSYTAIPVQSNIAATASITTSVVIEKSTFATFSGIANTYSTAITSNYSNVNVQANASLAAAGLTGPAIYASADISDTGYWTAAVYHPEISTPGYWIPAVTQWQTQSGLEQGRTGPNGASSGSYVSGHWWTDNNGNNLSGETTDTWSLSVPYFDYIPPSAGGPVYRYSIVKNVVITAAIWVPPVITQAAYTTPAFWTDTGFGPDAELTTANVEIILGSSLTVVGSADITTLPSVAISTSAVIAGSSELIEQSAVLGTVLANATVTGAAAISGIGFKSVYAQGSFLGSNITISTGTNTVLVSAVISTSAEVIAAAGLIRDAQASIEASASILPISGENFRRFADGVITGSAEVVGSSFNIASAEGIFLGSTVFISTGANTTLGFANITANADLSALPSLLGTIEASVIARAEIEVVKYVEVHVSANIAATTSLNAVLDVIKISQALIDITASSTVTGTAGVIQDDAATIAASASIIAIGGKLVSVTADVSDTGYWTPPYNSAEAYTEPAYDTYVDTPAAVYWVNNVNSEIQISVVWLSIAPYSANTTYNGTNIPTTILNTLNNAAPAGTHYYSYLSHAQTRSGVSGYAGGFKQRVTTTHPPVYVPAVVVPGYWTVTGLGPTSNITATAEVRQSGLFSATANVEGSIYLESTTTLNIEASTAITATDYVDVYVDGAFTGSNVTITAGEILIFASGAIEASATITAEADRSVIAKAFIEGSAGFTSQGAGLNVSEARVTASAEVAAEVTVLRYVAVPLNIDATVIITTRFVLLGQEGQRSAARNVIVVKPDTRALAIEVKRERVIYAKAA